MTPAPIAAVDLGRRDYDEVLTLQRDLCRRRVARETDRDLLLLVEHDPVITLGRGTKATSLPIAVELLQSRGVAVREVERGGDVTIHEPGQLVGYPIFDLAGWRQDLHWYLRALEGALIDGLGALGITAGRREKLTGVWVEDRKIASIGIHVKQWVTLHGFALNVVNDLALFDLVVPCGIHGVQMTTVARELGLPAERGLFERTRAAMVSALGDTFERPIEPAPPAALDSGAPLP